MNYQDYQNVRNNTWQMLIDCQVDTLPIKITKICQSIGIKAIPYNNDILQHYGVDKRKNDGFCIVLQGSPFIFYNPEVMDKRKRFTIAHELGHIMQGHLDTRHMLNREPEESDTPEEQEANMFAARLLAPACVLWGVVLPMPNKSPYCAI